jgi:RNA polymerase sigma-70 factor (ECF subfamily)
MTLASVVSADIQDDSGPRSTDEDPTPDWLGSVEAALSGDRAALAELYDRFCPVVRSLALSRLPPDLADDVVHDVFVNVLDKLHTLREPRKFPGWLAALARNRTIDYTRRQSVPLSERPEPCTSDVALVEARAVLRIVQSLPAAYAESLCMRLIEGMSGPEIAERTGMTEGSVRVNLHRGMKLLKEKLERGRRER